MYGKKYQWIFNGWYSLNWVEIATTDCAVEQIATAAEYALTADSLTYDMSNIVGVSGQVFGIKVLILGSENFKEGCKGCEGCEGYDGGQNYVFWSTPPLSARQV